METMGPRPSKGHTGGGGLVGSGWIFRELELSGHDPCGLQAHCEQGTGTCAKPRREVPRALGGVQQRPAWAAVVGQCRPGSTRWSPGAKEPFVLARSQARAKRSAPDKAASRARGCSGCSWMLEHRDHRAHLHCTTQHPTSEPTPPSAQPSSTTTTSLSYAHAQPRPS
jgi:hypothetical protein